MINLDKKDLKLRIKDLYDEAINGDNLDSIIALDIVKSISGIDINNINPKLLDWYVSNYSTNQAEQSNAAKFDKIPEAISFFNLENCLLEKKHNQALECVYHLSVVSEGRQILEFFIEFSLKYTDNVYRYIWYIFRMQVFLDSKTMLFSLNKCVDLIISSDLNLNLYQNLNNNINWVDYLSFETKDVNSLLLLYSIYNTELTRSIALKKIISERLFRLEIVKANKLDQLNISASQLKLGRKWILNFINNHENLKFDILETLNNARSSLMLSRSSEEAGCIWAQINNQL